MNQCKENACEVCGISEQLSAPWKDALSKEFSKEYFLRIIEHLHGNSFYPSVSDVLRCFSYVSPSEVKVVILGQDPYHGEGQATGLSFSVPRGVSVPRSLINIKKEIFSSTGAPSIVHGGCLVPWAQQGVLLLNTCLSVEPKKPRSHNFLKWSIFTDKVIELINKQEKVVFILWGKDAEKKEILINKNSHLILKSPHPSPFSARKGFLGCNHFLSANEFLVKHKKPPISW
ncbi:uracil-DNA glycosylase [Nematocida sp. LUAm3]|nr:uracil-DNA glycosylase [Nematocida sp. LUAm3]KAI5173575.1 uracil-DNA glycosylase [Nematocida sp. LUAm2]KAI5176796.1 uracil-DNA glycosylase [Nematocida sp. LUAm1]